MDVLTYIYLIVVFISFVSSLISFRLDFPLHLKVFSLLLGLALLVELYSSNLFGLFKTGNNYALYNVFSGIEFWVYGWFYYCLVQVRVLKRIVFLFLLIFPIFWMVTVLYVFGFNVWNSYVLTVGSFFSVVFVLMYFYQIVMSKDVQSLRDLPEFWIAMGMLIFYLGALPYFGTLNFLNEHHRSLAMNLMYVFLFLDTIMYCLFIYAYLCRTINTKKSK